MRESKGLVIVNTGNGKGKTTAALGIGIRAWGQGMRVLILQFIKGHWKYGELNTAQQLGPRFVMRQMGEGFVRGAKAQEGEHEACARQALAMAKEEAVSGKWDMLILDEINYAVKFGIVPVEDIIELISAKPDDLHLVLTGRDADPAVIDAADLVTEMREIKHPYKKGIKAQRGIEF